MEPKQQIEIQLGHMCNNRCVFCVSGQQTAEGLAGPLDVDPVIREIEKAFAAGHRKLTLLGSEPTLQPGFLDVVRRAVALGYEEIVLFTNGVKTAREAFIDEIVATGGRFTWRISIQGATAAAHERTTLKEGSFARIQRTMATLARTLALAALRALEAALVKSGLRLVHPLGPDAVIPVARSVGARLARLRAHAPFGELAWESVAISDGGKRAEASFCGPTGERATVWLAEQAGRATGGYRVDAGEPTPTLVDGLRAVMTALRPAEERAGIQRKESRI